MLQIGVMVVLMARKGVSEKHYPRSSVHAEHGERVDSHFSKIIRRPLSALPYGFIMVDLLHRSA
jgi:hypothetical protein